MKVIAAAFIGMLALTSLPTAAETGFLDRSITVSGVMYQYQVYVPLDWTPQQKWPIALYLHGADPVGQDGMSHVNGAHANAIRAERARFPVVFVLPQARAAWSTAPMQDLA